MFSPTHGVGSPPLTRREVVDLVESNNEAWAPIPNDLGALGNLMPPASPATDATAARNPMSPPTLGMMNVDLWDPFMAIANSPHRRSTRSPMHARTPSPMMGENNGRRRQFAVPARLPFREGSLPWQPSSPRPLPPLNLGPASRSSSLDSLGSPISTFGWGASSEEQDSVDRQVQPQTTQDVQPPPRRRGASPRDTDNYMDLGMLNDDDLMVYLAAHPLDAQAPPDPDVTRIRAATPIDLPLESPKLSYEVYAEQVLEVFPDVSLDHLKILWDERVPPLGSADRPLFKQDQIAQTVILQLIDQSDYPREKPMAPAPKRKRSTVSDSSEDELADWRVKRLKLRHDIDYIREMTIALMNEFISVPVDQVKQVCRGQIYLYESLLALAQADRPEDKNPNDQGLRHPRKPKLSLHTPPKEVSEVLHAEFVAARRLISKRDARRKKVQEDKDAAVAEQVLAEETGAMCECQCCFTDTPIPKAVHCNGTTTHFFCNECALNYAKSLTEKGQYQLICFATTECKAEFSYSDKLRFLDADMLKLLDKLEQNDIMRIAEIEGLARCPFCDYAEIYPDVLENKVFRCKAFACLKTSCRLCNLESHIPKTCAEAKAENGISERHVLEEAMTNALVRKCPRCETPVLKDSGCNKMICTKCRCAICDYCGKDITKEGYGHFGGQGTSRPNACPTTDDTYARNDERIKTAEKEALAKIRAENPELSEEDLKIKFSEKVNTGMGMRPGMPDHPYGPFYPHPLQALNDEDEFLRYRNFMPRVRRRQVDPFANNAAELVARAELHEQVPPMGMPNPHVRPDFAAMQARMVQRQYEFLVADGFARNQDAALYGPNAGNPPPRPEAPLDPIAAERREYLDQRNAQNEEFRRRQEAIEQRRLVRDRRTEAIQRRIEENRQQSVERLAVQNNLLNARVEMLNRRLTAHQGRPAEDLERVMREPWDPADERAHVTGNGRSTAALERRRRGIRAPEPITPRALPPPLAPLRLDPFFGSGGGGAGGAAPATMAAPPRPTPPRLDALMGAGEQAPPRPLGRTPQNHQGLDALMRGIDEEEAARPLAPLRPPHLALTGHTRSNRAFRAPGLPGAGSHDGRHG